VANALALLLGAAGAKAVTAKKGLPEDLIKAVADFRAAPTDTDAAEALVLAVQLAGENGNSDLSE
jgi:hypothetical protein